MTTTKDNTNSKMIIKTNTSTSQQLLQTRRTINRDRDMGYWNTYDQTTTDQSGEEQSVSPSSTGIRVAK
jgi:hypothetical protein